MTYVSQQQVDQPTGSVNYPDSFDPSLLAAAQAIYSSYCKTHAATPRRPVGVAIHQKTGRGQLVFKGKPILLPDECFVPFEQIEFTESGSDNIYD